MGQILHRPDLSETEKVHKYDETLFKLQNSLDPPLSKKKKKKKKQKKQKNKKHTHKKKTPSMLSSTDSPQTIKTDHTQSASVALHDQILQSVPKTMERKAELLLGMIKDNNNLTWDEQGVVSYKRKRIHGSNIIDLINDAKGVEPRGWKTFSKALHESNIPQKVIGNSSRWKWMQKSHDTRDGEESKKC